MIPEIKMLANILDGLGYSIMLEVSVKEQKIYYLTRT